MAMKKGNKLLVVGGILAVGAVGYFLLKKNQASASSPAAAPGNTPSSGTSNQVISAQPSPPPAAAPDQVAGMQQALLQWSTGSKNPNLYAQWIKALTAQQTSAMYDIVTNYWSGKSPETPT